jgi:hypothetical protein
MGTALIKALILALEVETNRAPWVVVKTMAVQRTYAILMANRLPVIMTNIQIHVGIVCLRELIR